MLHLSTIGGLLRGQHHNLCTLSVGLYYKTCLQVCLICDGSWSRPRRVGTDAPHRVRERTVRQLAAMLAPS